MGRIKFDFDALRSISFIQKVTDASVKDCVEDDGKLLVIVQENELSKAIGKGGENVKKLEKGLNRKIKIIGFNPDVVQFIKNLIAPYQPESVEHQEGSVVIVPPDVKTRGYLIGRNAQKLRHIESIVKRYFPIKEIRIAKQKG